MKCAPQKNWETWVYYVQVSNLCWLNPYFVSFVGDKIILILATWDLTSSSSLRWYFLAKLLLHEREQKAAFFHFFHAQNYIGRWCFHFCWHFNFLKLHDVMNLSLAFLKINLGTPCCFEIYHLLQHAHLLSWYSCP